MAVAGAARRLGLEPVVVPGTSEPPARFVGTVGALSARISVVEETIDLAYHGEFSDLFQRQGGARMPFARLTLLPPLGIPAKVCFQIIKKTPETIELGSKEAVALLDHATASVLRLGDTLGVFEDHVRFDALLTRRRQSDLHEAALAIADFAARLLDPDFDPIEVLLERIDDDPSADVRARAVEAVLSTQLEHQLEARVVEKSLADEAPAVRFAAARKIGPRGFEAVEAIASATTVSSEAVRERALVHAARSFPVSRAQDLLLRGLEDPSWTIQFTVLSELADRRFRAAIPALIRALPRVSPPAMARYAETLGELGWDAASQSALLEVLGRSSVEARIAAADALGRIGDRAALRPLGRALLFATSRELRLALATAIDLVRTRSGEAQVGGLSLSSSDESRGALAVAPGRGDVSLYEPGTPDRGPS